ncbi:MAG: PIN domain-containing protein [bacterium]|nr:PIN domain-containing protein [bacterium]
MRVFIDSDVVISSLISSSGAAYFLLHQSQIKPVISSISLKELRVVVKRMGIELEKLEVLIKNRFEVFPLIKELKGIKEEYVQYVTDIDDTHIVAGAYSAKVKYLISYNLKHFKKDKIKNELGLILLTPALFLQYLRSQ